MPEISPEQQKALDEQKKQCIFCKIISGEIKAKKIFEDDKIVAILDINPIAKGHILVMPKEHYPIMPLLPEETFKHMFKTTKELCMSLKKSILRTGTTTFIANGYVAGQVSPHFMFHIIPREGGDGLVNFETTGKVDQDLKSNLSTTLKNNLPMMMENHFKKNPEKWHLPKTSGPREYNEEEVIQLIKKNPHIENIIKTKPEELINEIPRNEKLKMIFKNVDVNKIISKFNPAFVPTEIVDMEKPNTDDIDVYALIEKSPKLKNLLLADPEQFKKTIDEVPELKEIFKGKNIDEIIKKCKETEKSSPSNKVDSSDKATEYPPITEDIYTLINKNPKLKDMILNEPERFKITVNSVEQLKELFRMHDLDEIIEVCKKEEKSKNDTKNKENDKTKEKEEVNTITDEEISEDDKSDLDKITGLFK